tara:strand:- start:405 stop:776 length:372 start_codon:yes stop_codon:yes gene_type:complete
MEELARAHGTVTGYLEAALEGTNLRMIDEVEGGIVATCGGSELARENGSSGRGAKYAGSMGVGEVEAALGQAIDIWGDGCGCCVVAPDPIVHVIDREEQDIGSLGRFNGANYSHKYQGCDCCE